MILPICHSLPSLGYFVRLLLIIWLHYLIWICLLIMEPSFPRHLKVLLIGWTRIVYFLLHLGQRHFHSQRLYRTLQFWCHLFQAATKFELNFEWTLQEQLRGLPHFLNHFHHHGRYFLLKLAYLSQVTQRGLNAFEMSTLRPVVLE